MLLEFIGDKLLLEYQKKDPKEQSVWNSEPNGYIYLLREANGASCIWNADRDGSRLGCYIIQPLLRHIEKDINRCIKKSCKRYADDYDNLAEIDRSNLLDLIKGGMEIIHIIDTGKLEKDIIKYLAGPLYLNKK
jgi:hypothetical protein